MAPRRCSSWRGMPVRPLLRDRFDSVEARQDSLVPVAVLSGDADTVVAASLSASLADQVGNLHTEIVLEGVGHNDDVWFGPYLAEVVTRFAESVARP